MPPASSARCPPEHAPLRKTREQLRQEYRSREIDGFSKLRDALLLVDPFNAPLGRDATRPHLLVTAAKKLQNLADENEKLMLRLSAIPTMESTEPGARIPLAMTSQDATDTVAWTTASEPVSPRVDHQDTPPAWSQYLHSFYVV